jgi:hypothetical protein
MTEQAFVTCVVDARDREGRQMFFRYCYSGTDHAEAARQAFKSFETSYYRVVDIETYDGPPRRWDPMHDVEERT